MLNHIMLDLETWGTSPYSTIISVGACLFNPYTLEPAEVITERFEIAVDPVSCQGLLRIDPKTVLWWMDGERIRARTDWLGKPKLELAAALYGFEDWLHSLGPDANDLRIWGNGSDFDNALLAQAYEVIKRDVPWSFRHNRCFRTLKSLTTSRALERPVAHTALADAVSQAIHANHIVRHLGIKLT